MCRSVNMHKFVLVFSFFGILSGTECFGTFSFSSSAIFNIGPSFSSSRAGFIQTCILPQKPQYGDWQVVNGEAKNSGDEILPNSVVKYTCIPGYKLNTVSPYMICDEHWQTNNAPQCKQLCPAFHSTSTTTVTCRDVNGAETDCSEVEDGGTMSYECMPYYEVPHRSPKQLFCQEGAWKPNKPQCESVCGKKVSGTEAVAAIGGGQVLKTVEYPWITAIYQKVDNNYINICGGNIITRKLILSAAHCITNDYGDAQPAENYKIATAKLYSQYNDPRDPKAQYLDIENIFVHPQYKGESRRYVADIVIITTIQLFTLGPLVQPVCVKGLTDIHLHAAYDKGEVAGWGHTEDGQQSDELRFLVIPYKSQNKCEQELPPQFTEKFKFEDKMCAGFHNRSMSVCKGDSGSGLVYQNRADNNRYYIHGIVSITPSTGEIDKCNIQQNSLYTKVSYYYEWIEKHIIKYQVEDCQLPPYPKNGRYSVGSDKQPGAFVFSNEWLIVSCDAGFAPVGPKISCESANNLTLKCQKEEPCPKPNFPEDTTFVCTDKTNVIIDCARAITGSALQYKCPQGYVSNGQSIRFCSGSSWGASIPQCVQMMTEVSNINNNIITTTPRSTDIVSRINYEVKVICTYASWSYYKGINPEDLDPYLCTHIFIVFGDLWSNGVPDADASLYRRVAYLKLINKKLKVILSVGVADGSPSKVDSFINSTYSFMEDFNYDGLNVDFHHPDLAERHDYIGFLRRIKAAYKDKGWLLTVSVRSDPESSGYNAVKLNRVVDWVIIKTFDFYGGWSSYTGEHTALYPSSKEYGWDKSHLNLHSSATLWLSAGVDKSKMIVSVAFYARTFQLRDKNLHDIHAPVVGFGEGDDGGIIKYSEICSEYKNWSTVWNDDQKSVYMYKGDQWFSYDNKDAIWFKGSYIREQGFLGVNIWPIDGDDIFGKCGQKFPLLKQLHVGLGHQIDKT